MSAENAEEHASPTTDDCGTYTAPCGCVVVQRTLDISSCPAAVALEQQLRVLARELKQHYLRVIDEASR